MLEGLNIYLSYFVRAWRWCGGLANCLKAVRAPPGPSMEISPRRALKMNRRPNNVSLFFPIGTAALSSFHRRGALCSPDPARVPHPNDFREFSTSTTVNHHRIFTIAQIQRDEGDHHGRLDCVNSIVGAIDGAGLATGHGSTPAEPPYRARDHLHPDFGEAPRHPRS